MPPAKPSLIQDLIWRFEALCYDAFIGLMRLIPVDTASDLGGWLFRTFGPMTSVQKTVTANLDIAFPEKTPEEKAILSRKQWENVGRMTAEFPLIDRLDVNSGRIEVIGSQYLDDIIASGRPVVFISCHQSNWEVASDPVFSLGITVLITYRAANNPYVDERIKKGRERFGIRLFAPKGSDGAKDLLIAMKQGESVYLMNDQKFNRGVPTPFFGHIVETAPGPTRLAQRFGTYLQPITVKRLHKARFQVIIHPPIHVDDTGNKTEDIDTTVCKVTAFVENLVRETPEEWFWVHKRWPNEVYAAYRASKDVS